MAGLTQANTVANTGVEAGTYQSPLVTLGSDGRVSSASNGAAVPDFLLMSYGVF